MSNWYEGISLNLKEGFSFVFESHSNTIKLDSYDIDTIEIDYEHKTCGCCEGEHESVLLKPSHLCAFITSGGKEYIDKIELKNEGYKNEISLLKKELKKYKDVMGTLQTK